MPDLPPAKAPVAAHLGSEDAPTVGWFFTSEEPRRERQIAQTVFVPQKASVRHLAIQVAGAGLSGLNDASFYQLKVYESGQKPEKTFLNQPVVLNQSGLIKDSNGEWLVFPFGEPLNLKANHYYTFALQLLNPAPAHRVILLLEEKALARLCHRLLGFGRPARFDRLRNRL